MSEEEIRGLMMPEQEETKRGGISEACRQDISKCTLGELAQLVAEKSEGDRSFDAIGKEARREVEQTLFKNIAFAIALVIGINISLLFEVYVIPLIPVGGFWGIIITIVLFIGILLLFTFIKILYNRRVAKK